MSLAHTIATWRGRAADARRLGNLATATAIDQVLDDLSLEAEPFTKRLSEAKAALYTRRSVRWLRARFGAWERQGFAGWEAGGRRWYLQCALPVPMDTDSLLRDAERTAREDHDDAA